MAARSRSVAGTAENPRGLSGGGGGGEGIAGTQDLINDPSLAEVILPGKTKTPADYAYARWMQGGIEHGSPLHGVLMQLLTGTGFSADRGMADATGTDTVANNEGDAANGATVVKNSVDNNWYGTMAGYAADESAEEVSTPLGAALRVISEADDKVGDAPVVPVAALDSHFNVEVIPGDLGQPVVAGNATDDLPSNEGDVRRHQWAAAGGASSRGRAVASGGRYSGYGFQHPYGIARNSTQPRDDGIQAKKYNVNPYLNSMYGNVPSASFAAGGDKIDNPGGHRRRGTGQPH